jgi:hypothetical protein
MWKDNINKFHGALFLEKLIVTWVAMKFDTVYGVLGIDMV